MVTVIDYLQRKNIPRYYLFPNYSKIYLSLDSDMEHVTFMKTYSIKVFEQASHLK